VAVKLDGAAMRAPAPAVRPRAVIGFQPGPKAVGSFLPKLTAKAFEKYGFGAAAILTDWAEIVGPELARACEPERLKWPRRAEEEASGARSGATLMLRVEPARALDVQYRAAQLIERINGYFGYRAVTELRILQAPILRKAAPRPLPAAKPVADRLPQVGPIEDAGLREALERLGRSVGSRASA
jgi:hypothetical protein